MNREFLLLAHSLKLSEARNFSLGNWYVSEKLDGMRCIWLPDTRGVRVSRLPIANLDKDVTDSGSRSASGLWSRYAKPIWCPDWFVENLPKDRPLDGELWTGRSQFQRLTSIVKQKYPDERWRDVNFCVFDSPSFDTVYRDGKIHNGTLKKNFHGVWPWMRTNIPFDYQVWGDRTFDYTYFRELKPLSGSNLKAVHQEQLPWRNVEAVERLNKLLEETIDNGGEGLIVRAPHSIWEPIRSKLVLKIKPENEAEATVIGYEPGNGRLEGMIGSLTVEGKSPTHGHNVTFGLSGLSDQERVLPSTEFPVGTVVTYLYRETTSDGVPREARFLRVRSDF